MGRLLGRRRRRRARHEGADLVSAAVLLVLVVRQGPRLLPRGPARAPRRPRLSLAEAPAAGDPDRRGLLPFAGRLAHAGRGVERGRAAGGLRPHPLARLRGRHLGGALHGGEPQPALPRAPGVGHPRPRGPAGPGVAELRARERARPTRSTTPSTPATRRSSNTSGRSSAPCASGAPPSSRPTSSTGASRTPSGWPGTT